MNIRVDYIIIYLKNCAKGASLNKNDLLTPHVTRMSFMPLTIIPPFFYFLFSNRTKSNKSHFQMKIRPGTHQTWWFWWRMAPWRRPVGLNNVLFCLSKMAKNEICAKVSKNLDTNVLKPSQSVQHYCNIAGDILVWDFLPPCLLFKTPRTQWFDNDLIARYFQFEYSEATELYRFFNKNDYAPTLLRLHFNIIHAFFTLWPKRNHTFINFILLLQYQSITPPH